MGSVIIVVSGYHRGKEVADKLMLPEKSICNVVTTSEGMKGLPLDTTVIVVDFPFWPEHAKHQLYRLAQENYNIVTLTYALSTLN